MGDSSSLHCENDRATDVYLNHYWKGQILKGFYIEKSMSSYIFISRIIKIPFEWDKELSCSLLAMISKHK